MTIHIIEPSETLEFEVTTSEFLNIFDNERELIVVIGNKYNYRASAGSSIAPPEPFTVFEVRNPNHEALMFSFKNGMGKQTELSQMGDVVAVSSILNPVTVNPLQVTNFPAEQLVRVVNPSQINVDNVTAQFPELQKVEVTNHKALQKVEVTNQKEVQKVEVVKEGNATMSKLNDIVFDGSVKAFQANNNRKGVILVAPSSNRAPVIVLGLFAIEAGGYATVPETAAITVSGQTGDTIKASEAFYPVDFTINNPAIAVSTSTGSAETQAVTETVFATYHPKSGESAAVTYGDTVSGSSLKLCAFNYRGEVESDTESLDGKWRCQCAWVEGAGGGFWGLFSKVSE